MEDCGSDMSAEAHRDDESEGGQLSSWLRMTSRRCRMPSGSVKPVTPPARGSEKLEFGGGAEAKVGWARRGDTGDIADCRAAGCAAVFRKPPAQAATLGCD